MTDRELMTALQCCSPATVSDRNCASCPFFRFKNCHTKLCEYLIDYIVREQGKTERFARGVDSVIDAINNLHSLY